MLGRLLRRIRALYRAASASLAWRLVLGAAAIIAVALAAAAVALPSLYRAGLERQLDFELDYLMARLITRVSAEASGELVLAEPMTERDYESAYSGYYWQITSEGKVALASRSLAGWMLALKPPPSIERDIDQDTTFDKPPEGPQRLRSTSRIIRSDTLNKNLIYTVAAVRTELDENI